MAGTAELLRHGDFRVQLWRRVGGVVDRGQPFGHLRGGYGQLQHHNVEHRTVEHRLDQHQRIS